MPRRLPFKIKTKKRSRKAPATTAAKATKALAIAKQIQSKIEYKHLDYIITSDGVDTTGTTYPLLQDLSKDVNSNTRLGDEVALARLHLTGSIYLTSATPVNTSTLYRVVLVKGIRENNQVPLMGAASSTTLGVFDNTASAPLVYARKYLPNIRDTAVVFDKLLTIDPSSSTRIVFKWNIKLNGKTRYVLGGANTVEDNGYYLMVCTDNNTLAASISFIARVTFSDD